MPYVYSFCQIFQALRLLATLRLFQTLEYQQLYLVAQLPIVKIREILIS